MQERRLMDVLPSAMAQIGSNGGAFLTVKEGDDLNTMTIGWVVAGIMWGRESLAVAVRTSRYTFGIIERSSEFTVSVPLDGMQKELAYCGSRSGRDGDKFAGCALSTRPGVKTAVPIIDMSGLHFECRILYRAAMAEDRMHEDLQSVYPKKDLHTHYYGEIVSCYEL